MASVWWLLMLAWQSPEVDWAGTWKGTLVNHPVRVKGRSVETMIEIGAFPKKDGECAIWKSTFTIPGKPDVVKDYQLCRVNEEDLYFDDGKGTKLATQLIGGVLVTPYKGNSHVLVQVVRLRGDTLEQEIFTAQDRAAESGPKPTSLEPAAVQRIVLKRVLSK
jgi:hypothetical protein